MRGQPPVVTYLQLPWWVAPVCRVVLGAVPEPQWFSRFSVPLRTRQGGAAEGAGAGMTPQGPRELPQLQHHTEAATFWKLL